MIDLEVQNEISRLENEQERPFEQVFSILEMEEGEEKDTIVNGKLRTYIKRQGKLFYLEWTEV